MHAFPLSNPIKKTVLSLVSSFAKDKVCSIIVMLWKVSFPKL